MYVALYGYTTDGIGIRKHLGNITNVKITNQERVYDFSSAKIEGYCDFDTNDALIYVINTPEGRPKGSGFAKNIRKLEGNKIAFTGDDFKRILDTDILLDYTGDQPKNQTLEDLFNKISNSVLTSNRDSYMSKIPIDFIIPSDSTDVREVADYTGRYIIVNALKFLKVYLAYYGYYIRPQYDVIEDSISFNFIKVKENELTEIKLKDFKHDKVSNDIRLNKAVATIAYTPSEVPPEWVDSDELYYNSQPANNKATIRKGAALPPPEGYPPGFALRVSEYNPRWETANLYDYINAPARLHKGVALRGETECRLPTFEEAVKVAGDPFNYSVGTVVRVNAAVVVDDIYTLCTYYSYIKVVGAPAKNEYFKLSEMSYTKRPNLPEKIYLLGKDNNIYEGYESISESNRIYPVVSRIFEGAYLAEAQVNAVYELVNNRYIENIIVNVDNTDQPINLQYLDLYSMIRVYDDNGDYKDLPISEKITNYEKGGIKTSVKLGFKKTLLTEVIKNDIGEGDLIKQPGGTGGGGGTTIIEEQFDVWTGNSAPDPTDFNTWFKPIGPGDQEVQRLAPTSFRINGTEIELEVGQDNTPEIIESEPEEELEELKVEENLLE